MAIKNICKVCGSEYLGKRKAVESGESKYCSIKCASSGKYPAFEERFVVNKETGCHEWAASKAGSGYGAFSLNGKHIGAHRYAWIKAHGQIPEGLLVLHRCDNRACVNPDHLFLGTVKDNSDDMIAKGRAAWQKDHSAHVRAYKAATIRRNPNGSANSRLTTAQVVEIKKRLAAGEKQSAISTDYGVGKTAITHINTGRRWGHVSLE